MARRVRKNEKTAPGVRVTLLVIAAVCFLLGLPTIATGGWIFLLIGVPCLLLGVRSIKKPKNPPPVAASASFKAPAAAADPVKVSPPKKEGQTYKVAGVTHYQDAIRAMGVENDDYRLTARELAEMDMTDVNIYQYEFYPLKVELVPEPDNQYDPNAIKVMVDGAHVGYIKAGSCAHLLKVIKEGRIKAIDASIGGGKFKYLSIDDYDENGDPICALEKDETPFFVHLNITEV